MGSTLLTLKFDAESELYYLNARYYDAETARFITADSYMGETTAPQTLNRYSYCVNEPLRHWDPTGHVVTQYDLEHCDRDQLIAISFATDMYNAGKAANNPELMQYAHELAESIRNEANYSSNAYVFY